ncbi:LLM class flavin-dependent oxidoreductase [Frankia sp. Cpl3]|nr:LLM class flavin-dependent oxidoreductase [Frankia sp. Cpl3]
MEIWTSLVSPAESKDPRRIVERAREIEADGWIGAFYPDSQMMSPDALALLALCASATTNLKLGTGTSNPATRHPSIIASAVAAIQVLSGGRMTLSIGRGDSSLAYIGVPPVPLAYYEKSVSAIQEYLRGEPVSTDTAASFLGELNRGFDQLSVAEAPETSQIQWFPDDYAKPELEAAASGPKVIAIAARHADRISFALGADVSRLKWAIDIARTELERIGRDPGSLTFGAYIPCFPHKDVELARELASGLVASMSRFSAMHKKVAGTITGSDRENLERIAATYNMKEHGGSASEQARTLDADFIDKFALVGDPSKCVDRVGEIRDLGIDRLMLWTGGNQGRAGESYRTAVEELLPPVLALG